MSFQDVEAKIKLHIEELEDNLKYDKVCWENYNLDKVPVKNVIEDHHLEMIHHIEQIKYHLDKINYHKKRLDDIDPNLSNMYKKLADPVKESNELCDEGDAVQRSDEDKLTFKVKRVSKTSSLKYVLQWENFLEEHQKENNLINSVQYRNKCREPITDVYTSQMVKNRIEKFEGFQKPKRQSSTIETFLDFSGEKPRRIKSYPIIEDTEGEQESDVRVVKTTDSNDSVEPEMDKVKENYKVTKCEIRDVNGISVNSNGDSVVLRDGEINHAVGVSKPRIIEMHYKQKPIATDDY